MNQEEAPMRTAWRAAQKVVIGRRVCWSHESESETMPGMAGKGRGGRPRKYVDGVSQKTLRTPPEQMAVYQARADAEGLDLIDYLAIVLAKAHGLPEPPYIAQIRQKKAAEVEGRERQEALI